MKTAGKESVIEFEEKRSRFIGYIKPVSTVSEAERFINWVKERHSEATHRVPLYRVIENGQEYFKYSDDGEPTNTAGKPMAEIVSIFDVYNIAIVAVRYFGGIKLGAGGLIRNYAKTAKLALNESNISEYKEKSVFLIDFDYSHTVEVENFFTLKGREYEIEITEKSYSNRVTIKIMAEKSIEEELKKLNGIIIVKI